MVAARMPEEKKRAGNNAIARAGKTSSDFIGEVLDYNMDEGRVPGLSRMRTLKPDSKKSVALFEEHIASTALRVSPEVWLGSDGQPLSDNNTPTQTLEKRHEFPLWLRRTARLFRQ